jgi:hypothetical protein
MSATISVLAQSAPPLSDKWNAVLKGTCASTNSIKELGDCVIIIFRASLYNRTDYDVEYLVGISKREAYKFNRPMGRPPIVNECETERSDLGRLIASAKSHGIDISLYPSSCDDLGELHSIITGSLSSYSSCTSAKPGSLVQRICSNPLRRKEQVEYMWSVFSGTDDMTLISSMVNTPDGLNMVGDSVNWLTIIAPYLR